MLLGRIGLLAAVVVLAGGCSLLEEEPAPPVAHGLAIPSSEELAAAVDDAADDAVWGETTVPAPTVPASTAPATTTVDPRHAFAQAGAEICQQEMATLAAQGEPETLDEKVASMREVARAFMAIGDRLAGLTAPDGATQGHLDEAVRLFRRASELMTSMVETALRGDQGGVDAIQAELETVLGGVTTAVTAAGIPSCR